jgi:hypothetical protein
VERLPNGALALVAHCYFSDIQGIIGRIYKYDLTSKEGRLFYDFGRQVVPSYPSFLAGANYWVQESIHGLSGELYLVDADFSPERLLQNFRRIEAAAWLDPERVILLGLETGPSDFRTFDQIAAFATTPMNLYELDLATGSYVEILKNFSSDIGQMQISPSGNLFLPGTSPKFLGFGHLTSKRRN